MFPLSLTLTGFRGIRDGLGRDELALDFAQLAGKAELVAIAGTNGRGKTTILDNLHPYLTMPSRATAGQGAFSYYDHVCLPENIKELIWEHEGSRYRSLVVIRSNGRKNTEAFLFACDEGGNWQPVALPDGTVSDGKTRTYTRCVEHLLGSAETFFTSVFSAQGKRQLSAYQNAEIKTLLADLLGQDEIRALGRQSGEVVGLLKIGLATIRQEQRTLDDEEERLRNECDRFALAAKSADSRLDARRAAQRALDEARTTLAQHQAGFDQSRGTEAERARLVTERQEAERCWQRSFETLNVQKQGLFQRRDRLLERIASRRTQAAARWQALQNKRAQCERGLEDDWAVHHAALRQPLSEKILARHSLRTEAARKNVMTFKLSGQELDGARQRLQKLEQEAGQAAIRAEDLKRRFGLVNEVPCAGTSLQGECKLLGDAVEAKALMPSSEGVLIRLADERSVLENQIKVLNMQQAQLESSPDALIESQRREDRAGKRAARFARLAARSGELEQARRTLAEVELELTALTESGGAKPEAETDEERAEHADIESAFREIDRERQRQKEQEQCSLSKIDKVMVEMPPPFDVRLLAEAQKVLAQAQEEAAQAERDYLQAVRDAESLTAMERRRTDLAVRQQVTAARAGGVEKQLGDWLLLTKCLGNDGLIALAIDDAGPTLAGLANDLLLECYGPRFTVSILTQTETAKGEQREGFEILVHDGASGQSKRVDQMSGGERVWINECLLRAVALYLSMHTGRRYGTLFCDEADGPLDAERKRMFMSMKRAVLRLGGYAREIFISQTPELTQMADAVIDLANYVSSAST
ncbi:MAG: DNA repair protein [Betaproteobacteria bacterium]|nr:DNA repair protein [Betaproteobacteria bacterium]